MPSCKARAIGRKPHCLNFNLRGWNRTLIATAPEGDAARSGPFNFRGPYLNIYLDRLDQFVETVLLLACNRGDRRRSYPPYMALLKAARNQRMAGALAEAKRLRKQAQQMPSRDPSDPEFRRL
jgi:hypothetical protein